MYANTKVHTDAGSANGVRCSTTSIGDASRMGGVGVMDTEPMRYQFYSPIHVTIHYIVSRSYSPIILYLISMLPIDW